MSCGDVVSSGFVIGCWLFGVLGVNTGMYVGDGVLALRAWWLKKCERLKYIAAYIKTKTFRKLNLGYSELR